MHSPKGKAGPQPRGLSFPAAVIQTVYAPIISPFTPNALLFSQAIPTLCMPETRSKISDKAHLQFVEPPSAGLIECFDKCSDTELGPAVEQALEFSSSKEGEEWQASDAIVSIHNGKMRITHSPRHLATFTLPVAAPTAPSVPHTHTVAHSQHPDDSTLPFEMVSRQQGTSINKGPDVSKLRSPSLETARKWSDHTTSGEGGQLVRAAAYIQERLMRCSSACNEFVPRMPKVPPEKKVELDAQRCTSNVVSKDKKASINLRSPEFSMESVLPSRSQSKAVPSQPNEEAEVASLQFETPRANKLYMETLESARVYAGIKCKTTNDGVQECSSAQPVEAVVADRCSSEHLVEETEEEWSHPCAQK